MKRRQYLGAVVGSIAISGCASGEGGSDGGTSWDHAGELSSEDGSIHEFLIGELDDGNTLVSELVVNSGQTVSLRVQNRDTGNMAHDVRVFRSDRIEGYDPDDAGTAASPHRPEIVIQEFGEYVARVVTPGRNVEAEFRYRTE